MTPKLIVTTYRDQVFPMPPPYQMTTKNVLVVGKAKSV